MQNDFVGQKQQQLLLGKADYQNAGFPLLLIDTFA